MYFCNISRNNCTVCPSHCTQCCTQCCIVCPVLKTPRNAEQISSLGLLYPDLALYACYLNKSVMANILPIIKRNTPNKMKRQSMAISNRLSSCHLSFSWNMHGKMKPAKGSIRLPVTAAKMAKRRKNPTTRRIKKAKTILTRTNQTRDDDLHLTAFARNESSRQRKIV